MDFLPSPADWPVTRAEAVRELGPDVTPHMVSMWVLRGWTDDHGQHHEIRVLGTLGNRRLYRLGDLQDAERATRRSPKSHRRKVA